MQEPASLKINKIFWSIQGEGLRAGVPSIFIRLSGCSLKCTYCDSKETWTKEKFLDQSQIIGSVESLRNEFPQSQIVITGGEPLEQDVSNLISHLKTRQFFVSIETNGNHFNALSVDWWTVSPKDVNDFFIHPKLSAEINELKLVVTPRLSLARIEAFRNLGDHFPIFLQPQHGDAEGMEKTFNLYQECQKGNIENIRLGFQLHRFYHID